MPDFKPGETVKLKLTEETKNSSKGRFLKRSDGRAVQVRGAKVSGPWDPGEEVLVRTVTQDEAWIKFDDVEPL